MPFYLISDSAQCDTHLDDARNMVIVTKDSSSPVILTNYLGEKHAKEKGVEE